jgi:hypothetical protein
MKMDKVYEFNGKKYSLRELDLDLMHRASPLLIRYRELHYKYTFNIDTSKLDAALFEAEQLRLAIKDLKDNSEHPDIEHIGRLELKLSEAESALKNPALTALQKYLSDTEALVLYEILTDAEFISKILNGILIVIDEKKKPEIKKEELQDKQAIKFIKEVIGDFFLLTAMSS